MSSNARMNTRVTLLAMRIFVQMAAQHTVRHGVHDSRVQAASLARESFRLAEVFEQEREARSAPCVQNDGAHPIPA